RRSATRFDRPSLDFAISDLRLLRAARMGPLSIRGEDGSVRPPAAVQRCGVHQQVQRHPADPEPLSAVHSTADPGHRPVSVRATVGSADIKGVELQTNIRPTSGMMIDRSFSYLDFAYSEIDPQAGGPTNPGGVQFGMRLPTRQNRNGASARSMKRCLAMGVRSRRGSMRLTSRTFGDLPSTCRRRRSKTTTWPMRGWPGQMGGETLEASLKVTNLFD